MTVRKLSISVPAEVEETIKAAAAQEGKPVSTWLAEAATEKARAAALQAAEVFKASPQMYLSAPTALQKAGAGSTYDSITSLPPIL